MPQGLFDALSGAAGHPIDRPGLNAFVANSQAVNGLRSAQTEEALLNAQKAREEQGAGAQLEQALGSVFGPGNESKAHAAATIMRGHFGDAKTAMTALNELQQNQFRTTLGDPNQGGQPSQTFAQQGVQGKVAEPVALPDNFTTLPGTPPVVPQQSPQGAAHTALTQAQTGEQTALAGLNQHKDQDPAAFRAATFGNTPPEGVAALTKAVQEGRIDPTRINSRTAPILAQMETNTPGMNFNRLHADAALQSNATFQQKAMSVDMLPGLLQNVTSLGKKVGYNDNATVGLMQKWTNKEFNDPTYTEYMTARNDTLLRLAGVMRGVGMSDQAHTAEVEAMSPTLAPYALDAWLKGQMGVVTPLLERQNRITHLGEPGGGTAPLGAAPTGGGPAAPSSSAPPAAKAMSLDDYLKARGH